MFTGIIHSVATVVSVDKKPGLHHIAMVFPSSLLDNLMIGASVAINGTCLTVSAIDNDIVSFDVMSETLNVTNLSELKDGVIVNVERSARFGDEIGGHNVSGHIHGIATIVDVQKPENNHIITLQVPHHWIQYIFPKGFIALNGASLTIVNVDHETAQFTVNLIPETLRLTTFSDKTVGDKINFEVEQQTLAIVNTVKDYLTPVSGFSRFESSN